MKHTTLFALAVLALFMLAAVAPAQEYTSQAELQEKSADDWRDYLIQGEYVYVQGPAIFAAQVIADGKGEFTLVGYPGGFPGCGWHEKQVRIVFKGKIDDAGEFVNFTAHHMENKEDYQKELPIPEREKETAAKLDVKQRKVAFTSPGKPDRVARRFDKRVSPTLGLKAPEGATVFYDGLTEDAVNTDMIVDCKGVNEATGGLWPDMKTKPLEFGVPYRAHIEFMLSFMPNARGQGRANSGVYLDENYECQVLDSFGLRGENNECGGFYQIARPAFNACLQPLVWQTYDIDFAPAVYDEDGKKVENARVTVWHNGLKIHDDLELPGATGGGRGEKPEPRGIYFQGHGNKVQYRNIWVAYADDAE